MQRTMKSMVMTPQFQTRLASVNGVVIPSRVPQGEEVYRKRPSHCNRRGTQKRSRMICIICDADCKDQRGLRAHFVVCVERNGNPNGARWDDPLENRAASAGVVSSRSSESQELQYEDVQPEDNELDDTEPGVFALEDTLPDGFDKRHQQLDSAMEDGLKSYHTDLQHVDPQLADLVSEGVRWLYDHHPSKVGAHFKYLSQNATESYKPDFRIDVLPNQTLFLMVQDWQYLIDCEDEGLALESPRFHELMSELVERGLMSADWRWAVDVDSIDMDYARVMGEGLDV